jgi:hypothetical protein
MFKCSKCPFKSSDRDRMHTHVLGEACEATYYTGTEEPESE